MSRPPITGRSLVRSPVRQAVCTLLLGALLFCLTTPAGPSPERLEGTRGVEAAKAGDAPEFVPLGNAECWAHLPARVRGGEGPLPVWARVLARTLPRTTAAMLELDYLHRAGGALPPKLRGAVRWAAAHANGCEYGEAVALADLRVAGVDEVHIRALTGKPDGRPADTRAVVEFAFRLTLGTHALTDAEVARLVERYGEKQVVAIVLLVAYANFQDRLCLALDLGPEPGGAVPPLDVKFARQRLGEVALAPPRKRPALAPAEVAAGSDCPAVDLVGIRADLAKQRYRSPRIRLPESDPGTNRWGQVGQTYQPQLATAWSACTQAFGEEADQDPVFEQSLFWVVTRTKRCFY